MLTARPAADHAWHVGGVTGRRTCLPSYLATPFRISIIISVIYNEKHVFARTKLSRHVCVTLNCLYN